MKQSSRTGTCGWITSFMEQEKLRFNLNKTYLLGAYMRHFKLVVLKGISKKESFITLLAKNYKYIMKRFILYNLIFLKYVNNETSIRTKLFKLSIYFGFLLPNKLLIENYVGRRYPNTYMVIFIFFFYTLPLFKTIPTLILFFYIIGILVDGFIIHCYTKLYLESIKTLDNFLYKTHLRKYFLGNPGSYTFNFIRGGLAAYAFKVCGSHVEDLLSTRAAADQCLIMKKLEILPEDTISKIELFQSLKKEFKQSMPIEWSSNLVVDSINKVFGNITVSPNDFGNKK